MFDGSLTSRSSVRSKLAADYSRWRSRRPAQLDSQHMSTNGLSAAEYLFDNGVRAYPYLTEMPVAVLGAKYQWSRGAGAMPKEVSVEAPAR